MTVYVRLRSGAAMSFPHIIKIEHVRGEYAILLHHDSGGPRTQRLIEHEIESMKVGLDA